MSSAGDGGPGDVRERFARVVRTDPVDLGLACLLIAAEYDVQVAASGGVQAWTRALDDLARTVLGSGDALSRLRAALSGFTGRPEDYGELAGSLLSEVLRRRHGLPILLSVVWLEVARRAGIPAYGVGLPGHFVVGVGDPDGYHELVDPWSGGARWRSRRGDAAYERPWEPIEILGRVLANIRVWAAASPGRVHQRLQAVELSLLLPRHSLDLRRERAELWILGGDFLGGAAELDAYADVVAAADPAAAADARLIARRARARLN